MFHIIDIYTGSIVDGSAILIRSQEGYAKENPVLKLTIEGSTLISENGYGIRVHEHSTNGITSAIIKCDGKTKINEGKEKTTSVKLREQNSNLNVSIKKGETELYPIVNN